MDVACNEHIELKLPAPNKALPILDRLGFTRYRVVNDGTIHVFERLEDSGKIAMELAQNNIEIISISVASKAFENYFLEMIGGTQNV